MSEHDNGSHGIHLPEPSAQPIIASLGATLILVGLVPDSRLWRLTIVSVGATILGIAVWLWVSEAIDEYRRLDD
ncbi:MAG: hypothetical protein QOJ13_3676 [Gaiellales bacterium]|jgi:hypothetical protein|nr:hypothetical protein [Gaiellales bacterium]MDX6594480.1 hypothetical protein [Gaiellales bacterium]